MTHAEIMMVLGSIALILFISERLPSEVIAVGLLVSLPLTGVLDTKEALSGFSHSAVIQTGAFLVLSVALARTGFLVIIANTVFRAKGVVGLTASILVLCGIISPWIANTALVALLIPIVTEIAADRDLPLSKFLMPLSYGAIFGGVVTTIGTSSHIFGATLYHSLTGGTISLLMPAPWALCFLAVASVFILATHRWLIPARSPLDLNRFDLREYILQARILPTSTLLGREAVGDYLRKTHDISIVGLRRGSRRYFRIPRGMTLEAGDIILIRGNADELSSIAEIIGLEIQPDLSLQKSGYAEGEIEYAEIIVGPNARDVNRPLSSVQLLDDCGAEVLAVRRRGRTRRRRVEDILLAFGDVLILQGPRGMKEIFQRSQEYLFQREIELPIERRRRMPIALGTLIVVLVVGGSELVPMPIIAMAGGVFVVITGCLTPKEMHKALPWSILILVGSLVPLSIAFEKSGLAAQIAQVVASVGGQFGPRGALFIVAFTSIGLAQMIQPNGVVAVMLPLAVATARALEINPVPFALASMFGGAFSFATPFAYNTNMMVTPLAGYRTMDFIRLGLPLAAIAVVMMTILLPVFYPF
jgi:di/tricarboxylate transporter